MNGVIKMDRDIIVLVIPDPDEWVQTGRDPYAIEVPQSKVAKFSNLVLSEGGKFIREWLHTNGTEITKETPLSKIDYVVCDWF